MLFQFRAFILLCSVLTATALYGLQPLVLEEILPGLERADYVDPSTVSKSPSFLDGETLHFELGWSFFKVARAKMVIAPDPNEEGSPLKVVLQTRTNSFADAIYKVRNTSTSWMLTDVSGSLRFHAQQLEGARERDTEAIFDPVALTARYINNGNGENRAPVAILPGSFDPLGIVYFVRSLDFALGRQWIIPTSNGKEFFLTVVRVTDRVERRFASGRHEAWVVEPDIKDLGGVFKRSDNGHIRFYFSADEKKLPLRMESEVAVGSFWAELTKEE
jgi:hypothetical protein